MDAYNDNGNDDGCDDDNDSDDNDSDDDDRDDNDNANLNGIDSHGGKAQPAVDAVEMRDRVWLPIFVLPLLIMMIMMR